LHVPIKGLHRRVKKERHPFWKKIPYNGAKCRGREKGRKFF
jgi:hypothetical protein